MLPRYRDEGLPMKVWMCMNCGWTYDQAAGDAEGAIAPGTAWEDVPEDWKCPDCGAGKSDFDMVEV
jgi:rubredoxin